MDNGKRLTATHIKYLFAVMELDSAGRGARCVDVAAALKISKPSVHNMMDAFSEMGLIRRDAFSAAYLTPKGRETAMRYRRYYDKLEKMMRACFPKQEDLSTVLLGMLAELSTESLESFCPEACMA